MGSLISLTCPLVRREKMPRSVAVLFAGTRDVSALLSEEVRRGQLLLKPRAQARTAIVGAAVLGRRLPFHNGMVSLRVRGPALPLVSEPIGYVKQCQPARVLAVVFRCVQPSRIVESKGLNDAESA
jgi:hypothetical protein